MVTCYETQASKKKREFTVSSNQVGTIKILGTTKVPGTAKVLLLPKICKLKITSFHKTLSHDLVQLRISQCSGRFNKMPEILVQGIRLWCSGRSAKCNLMVRQKNSNYAFASSIKQGLSVRLALTDYIPQEEGLSKLKKRVQGFFCPSFQYRTCFMQLGLVTGNSSQYEPAEELQLAG